MLKKQLMFSKQSVLSKQSVFRISRFKAPTWRAIIAVFFTLAFLITGCTRVPKPIVKTQSYAWGVANINGSNSQIVCKQVDISIYRFKTIPTQVNSAIVDNRFCAGMAKPIVAKTN